LLTFYYQRQATTDGATPAEPQAQALPLTDTTAEAINQQNKQEETPREAKPRAPRTQNQKPKQRGPPEDGIPSKTKVMVANLPYDLSEETVCSQHVCIANIFANVPNSLSNSSSITILQPLKSHFALFLASWSRSFRHATNLARAVALGL
jgi:hypothetical protein